jgi:hypothetical protein
MIDSFSLGVGCRFENVMKQDATDDQVIVHSALVDLLDYPRQTHAEFIKCKCMFNESAGIVMMMSDAGGGLVN